MKKLIKCPVSTVTVRLIGRLLLPLAESGTISVPEMNEVMSNLRHLAQKGEMLPDVVPKLIDQKEAAEFMHYVPNIHWHIIMACDLNK